VHHFGTAVEKQKINQKSLFLELKAMVWAVVVLRNKAYTANEFWICSNLHSTRIGIQETK